MTRHRSPGPGPDRRQARAALAGMALVVVLIVITALLAMGDLADLLSGRWAGDACITYSTGLFWAPGALLVPGIVAGTLLAGFGRRITVRRVGGAVALLCCAVLVGAPVIVDRMVDDRMVADGYRLEASIRTSHVGRQEYWVLEGARCPDRP
ncbi:MAG: hypothetical protein RLY86_38 [Pseudomonadota bacterium]